MVKNPPAKARDESSTLEPERPVGEGNDSSILASEIPWTEGAWQAIVHCCLVIKSC